MAKSTKSLSVQKLIQLRSGAEASKSAGVHIYGSKVRCDTETQGFKRPHNRSPLELVLDASEGFIPLWKQNTTLRWKFRDASFNSFENPTALKSEVRKLLGEALLAWGDAAPINFSEENDVWDFEIIMSPKESCDVNGCVLARAFFPDAGRHNLMIWPTMFTQERTEQVGTLCHEIGHVFGLRHFFAQISETNSPSVLFGKQNAFTIMNYGAKSRLTDDDRSDLTQLYRSAWKGDLTEISGTPIQFVEPYHTQSSSSTVHTVAIAAAAAIRPPNLPLNPKMAMLRE